MTHCPVTQWPSSMSASSLVTTSQHQVQYGKSTSTKTTAIRQFRATLTYHVISRMRTDSYTAFNQGWHWRSQGGARPPKLGSQENSWLRRWAKYTKLRMGMPPEPPTRGPAGGLPFPRPLCPPTPNPGFATAHGWSILTILTVLLIMRCH